MPRSPHPRPPIQFRGGTAAEWAARNPVLDVREMGVETDTRRWKLGDGNTAWNALPYANEAPVNLLARASAVTLPLAAATALSHTNFNSVVFSSSHFFSSYRAGAGVLGDEVVFLLPSPLLAGTYAGTFVHSTNTSFGIITLSTSADGSGWTDHTTVDTYAATAANVVIAALPPLTVADGAQYVRLKVTGRNPANTTAYNARVSSLSLTRTGA